MTVKILTDKALKLYGAIDQSGAIDETKNTDYYTIAPSLIETIQEELSILEGTDLVYNSISNIDDVLDISDRTCNLCGVYQLAFLFAQIDGDDKRASNFFEMYNRNLKLIPGVSMEIEDVFNV